jgi:RNA polymerase sigma-70 factor (ECF subfamily)
VDNKVVDGNSINIINESLILKRAVYQQDRKAVKVLHAKYYLHMKCYIASRINSIADAEDLAQDVFVELCKGNGRYDGCRNVERYLFGIARNAIRRYYRERTGLVKTIPIEPINGVGPGCDIRQNEYPERQIAAQELKKAIEDLIAQLPPKAREAVRLRFFEGLSSKEAAKRAECSIHVFGQRVCNAIKALRKLKDMSESEL